MRVHDHIFIQWTAQPSEKKLDVVLSEIQSMHEIEPTSPQSPNHTGRFKTSRRCYPSCKTWKRSTVFSLKKQNTKHNSITDGPQANSQADSVRNQQSPNSIPCIPEARENKYIALLEPQVRTPPTK
eukprot:c30769_g1_i1 orf=146-523(+)